MSSSELRELFEACKTGDLIKVKKLLTQQNVNEIGESQGRNDGLKDGLTICVYFRHCGSTLDCLALRQRVRQERCCRTSASKRCQHRGQGRRRLEPSSQVSQPLNARVRVNNFLFSRSACSFGHSEVVSILLEAGANPNAVDNWNYTPLHEAVSKGKIDVCLALLQHGANAELRNSENKTPLDLADANTKPILTGEYRKDELLEAARLGDEQRLLELLNPLNVNCHASDGRRSTPLHLASGFNRIRIVQILLQHGADVHAKDKGGLVPLHNSSSYGHLEVSQLLIKAGANVNASGETISS